ncbi:hypothetical protein [Actinomycetospora aeridis]|uniref:Uncharacterized protein n=1 Tax=Actinomycetospora aeridis TaxID=3129231 RepID=A0ABU8N433_9PSEU
MPPSDESGREWVPVGAERVCAVRAGALAVAALAGIAGLAMALVVPELRVPYSGLRFGIPFRLVGPLGAIGLLVIAGAALVLRASAVGEVVRTSSRTNIRAFTTLGATLCAVTALVAPVLTPARAWSVLWAPIAALGLALASAALLFVLLAIASPATPSPGSPSS